MPQQKKKPRFFYGYAVIAAGFLMWMLSWGINQSFGVFFKPLIDEFAWSRAETALAYSIVPIVIAFLGILMGWLTDRLGPRVVVIVFGSFIGVSYLLMSLMNSLWQFYTFYALAAVGFSTATVPIMATVARWFLRRRALMTGIVQTGVGIGGFIVAPLTGWLIGQYGWRNAYSVLGTIALIGVIITGLIIRRDPRDMGQLPDGANEEAAQAPKVYCNSVEAADFTLEQVFGYGQFWIIIGIFFSFGFCRATFLPHIPAHVQDLGYTLADGARVIAILTISSIVGRLWIGWLPNRQAFMLSFAVTTIALVWGLFASKLWGLYIFAVVFGFGWGAQAVLRFTIVADSFGLMSLGLIMGLLSFSEAVASALGSYFGGYVFDAFGSYQLAFYFGIAFSILAIVLAWQLKPET
jgi:MFS family permease